MHKLISCEVASAATVIWKDNFSYLCHEVLMGTFRLLNNYFTLVPECGIYFFKLVCH